MAAVRLKGGNTAKDPKLGRVPPEDWRHVEKYPVAALSAQERPRGVPVGIGVNWYRNCYADRLVQKSVGGRTQWWMREDDLGALYGGHAVVLEAFDGPKDIPGWYAWHDQVSEGICVSEMAVRMMAHLNRKRYQPRPVYDHAQTIDYWPGENYSGTSVDAGLATLRDLGAVPAKRGERHYIGRGEVTRPFQRSEGIAANRWARDDAEVFAALGSPDGEYAVLLNSWGRDGYPHRVRVPRSVIARWLAEDGEFGIVTDL